MPCLTDGSELRSWHSGSHDFINEQTLQLIQMHRMYSVTSGCFAVLEQVSHKPVASPSEMQTLNFNAECNICPKCSQQSWIFKLERQTATLRQIHEMAATLLSAYKCSICHYQMY